MKDRTKRIFSCLAMVVLTACLAMGCGSDEKEQQLKQQIKHELTLLETQVSDLEAQQDNMLKMVDQLQSQLEVMKTELQKEDGKLTAANANIKRLRELSLKGLDDDALAETIQNPSYNVLWLMFFVLLLWVLYRMRVRSNSQNQ